MELVETEMMRTMNSPEVLPEPEAFSDMTKEERDRWLDDGGALTPND